MIVHCLFEQSGTFKNEFKKLGFDAIDYDILNLFNQTDIQVDLFDEIDKAYNCKSSLFDLFSSDDLLIAFYPCIRFEDQSILLFKCSNFGMKDWSDKVKCQYDIQLMNELHDLYVRFHKLIYIALDRNLKLIVENPYSTQHFLYRYSFLSPAWIDKDRRLRGDYYRKPTQYFFINFKPSCNFVSEALVYNDKKNVVTESGINRSLISPDYAYRFIKEFIL